MARSLAQLAEDLHAHVQQIRAASDLLDALFPTAPGGKTIVRCFDDPAVLAAVGKKTKRSAVAALEDALAIPLTPPLHNFARVQPVRAALDMPVPPDVLRKSHSTRSRITFVDDQDRPVVVTREARRRILRQWARSADAAGVDDVRDVVPTSVSVGEWSLSVVEDIPWFVSVYLNIVQYHIDAETAASGRIHAYLHIDGKLQGYPGAWGEISPILLYFPRIGRGLAAWIPIGMLMGNCLSARASMEPAWGTPIKGWTLTQRLTQLDGAAVIVGESVFRLVLHVLGDYVSLRQMAGASRSAIPIPCRRPKRQPKKPPAGQGGRSAGQARVRGGRGGESGQGEGEANQWNYGLGTIGEWYTSTPCVWCNASAHELYECHVRDLAFVPRDEPFEHALIKIPRSRFHYGRLHRTSHLFGGWSADTIRFMALLDVQSPFPRRFETLLRGHQSERGSHSFDPLRRKKSSSKTSSAHTVWPAIYERVLESSSPVFDIIHRGIVDFFNRADVIAECDRIGVNAAAFERSWRYQRRVYELLRSVPTPESMATLRMMLRYIDVHWLRVARSLAPARPEAFEHLEDDVRPTFVPGPTARSISNHANLEHTCDDLAAMPPSDVPKVSEKVGEAWHNPCARCFAIHCLACVAIKQLTPRLHLRVMIMYSMARALRFARDNERAAMAVELDEDMHEAPKHCRPRIARKLHVKWL